MTRIAAALALALIFVAAGGATSRALAQAWVQLEAHPTLRQAEDSAQSYSQLFPDVEGFRLTSGWYAVSIGPYREVEAQQRLNALLSERLIPRDAYVYDGQGYTQQFWPVGAAATQTPETDPSAPITTEVLPDPGADGSAGDMSAGELADRLADDLGDATDPEADNGVSGGVSGGEVAAAEPAPEPVIPEETVAEARRSEAQLTRDERAELQVALKYYGFYTQRIDAAFGRGTRASMAAWQSDKGYEPTGVLTTRQRAELLDGYHAVLDSIGLTAVRDNTAGIAIRLPMAMVQKGSYQPPFAQYDSRGESGVRVILISQEGDADTLFGLYDILQTLEIMPLEGPRERRQNSFTIEGSNAKITSYATARLTSAGNVKGFILIWPTGDDKRREMVLSAMEDSFQVMGDSVLPDSIGDGAAQDVDLVSGLEVRRPEVTRSGFYVDGQGHVLTTADAVAQCGRITLDGEAEARVMARDAGLGLAVLEGTDALVPIDYARFTSGSGRLGSEVAVSGYAYDGRLGAPVLTFGRLEDVKGLDGNPDMARLALVATGSDAGGPVFDGSGAVVGMLLSDVAPKGQVLPEEVAFAAGAPAIATFLSGQGVSPAAADLAGDLSPEALTEKARDMTVMVSCWN